jgi:hypothetical protein
MNFRLFVQPTVAAVIAIQAGLKDAMEGRPAFLWAAFTNSDYRSELLHQGWKEIRTVFILATILDAIYQLIVHRGVYVGETLITATLLAIVPYVLIRGPVNRVARRKPTHEKSLD